MSTILIAGGGTGGHLMPALAIAGELRRTVPNLEPVLVGATRGIENEILPTRDFRYSLLPSEPIYRNHWWKNIRWPVAAVRLLIDLRRLFDRERPVVVLGTGGYASAPVVWYAARHGIPTAIQEQNAFPGLATRWLSSRVRHVYLGAPEARARLHLGPHTQVFETGNPIVMPDPERRAAALMRFGLRDRKPVLLITGGSQGALAINRAVAAWLDRGGPRGAVVLWITGRGTYHEFSRYHALPGVQVFDFLDPIADAYAVADLVVGRAGMMTGAELCAWGLPSVLIPLPTSAADHQTYNARALAEAGAARLLLQEDLTSESLSAAVDGLLGDSAALHAMADRARERGKPLAARDIVSRILTLFGPLDSFTTA